MSRILLGIDIGTSACKVAAFDIEGRVITQATREYKVYYPRPGFVEQDPMEWWKGVSDAIKDVLDTGMINSKSIAGVGVDGQSWSAIPVDRDGNVLGNTPAKHAGKNIAVYNQKDRRQEIFTVGILDIERSQSPDIKPAPWQTDTCVGHWFYDVRAVYKKPGHVLKCLLILLQRMGTCY